MEEQLKIVWNRMDKNISESKILSLLVNEITLNDIDYGKYPEFGYSQEDVTIGFELIQIYKTLKRHIKD